MIPTNIFLREEGRDTLIMEMTFAELPDVGSQFERCYKIISISHPIAMGTNISANEPKLGARILVEKLPSH